MRTFISRPAFAAKAAGVLMAAGVVAIATSGSASAAGVYTAYTSDSGATGGHASYNSNTSVLTVCDTQADGLRVYGSMTYLAGNEYLGTHYSDANGNGTCVSGYTASLRPGVRFTVSACLEDGPTGPLRYCRSVNGSA